MPPRAKTSSQDEALRIAKLVEDLILLKKKPVRQIERELGISQGTLNRILTGKIQLKLVHLLDILTVLDVPFASFFVVAYAPEAVKDSSAELAQLQRLAGAREIPPVQLPRAEMRDLVLELLEELGVSAPSKGHSAAGESGAERPDDLDGE
ncbi:MAG TPA: helix-turn-helix domain-containing protein [Thermoanaerobaculia bacterium]|nr:helix-turn-helix domain-containing protein [Thermoanaerobaculia bacterium]